jgi:hypothetical protein
MLSACLLAAINFLDILSQTLAPLTRSRRDGDFEVIVCSFGPPPPFYPRFFVLVALLVAALTVFKRTAFNRFFASVGSAAALTTYILWWMASYRTLRDYEELAEIRALIHPEIKQFAYLYHGTPLDLGIAISTAVCLVLLLDRLCDGALAQFEEVDGDRSKWQIGACAPV